MEDKKSFFPAVKKDKFSMFFKKKRKTTGNMNFNFKKNKQTNKHNNNNWLKIEFLVGGNPGEFLVHNVQEVALLEIAPLLLPQPNRGIAIIKHIATQISPAFPKEWPSERYPKRVSWSLFFKKSNFPCFPLQALSKKSTHTTSWDSKQHSKSVPNVNPPHL